jgi:hypothetical protein
VLVFLEITIATVSVVGLFNTACQPFSWQCALQFLLFALLGALLWVADAMLEIDESSAAECRREESNHQPSTGHPKRLGRRAIAEGQGHIVRTLPVQKLQQTE